MIKVSNFNLALKEKAVFCVFSVFSLTAILLGFFIFPSLVPESSYADDFPPPISDPSISIAPAGGINLVMTPNVGSGGSFGTAIANVTVNTSNTTGYTFTMNTETTNTDLLNNKIDYTQSGMSDFKITNLTASATTSNFPLNKWGYNVHKSGTYIKGAANTYVPVPNSGSSDADRQIEVTDAAGSNTYSFAYGVKANVNMPSGDYSTTIVFSATANPMPYMQDFDYTACQALTAGQPITLYDERDSTPYTIAKLADDNCWMLDNLGLDITNSTTLNSLTTDNTNADSASLTSLKSGNRSAGTRYASSGFAAWAQGDTVNAYNQAKANADYKNTTTTSYGAGSGKIGVYYNYCAASAGNYCYDQNAGVDDTSTLQDAKYDICPKNWRMPTSTSSSEYQALLTAYNNNQTATDSGSLQYNLSTPLSGNFYGGSARSQGSDGGFWSSTWYDASDMGGLYVNTSNVDPFSINNRRYGFSVRCLVQSTTIAYDSNNATSNNGIGATHEKLGVGDTVMLFPSNDYKTDYGFAGWSTDPNAGAKVSSSNAATRNSVKVYGPMEAITIDDTLISQQQKGLVTLYAVWVPSAGSMQSFDATACDNLAGTTYTNNTIVPGQITARKDSRDNNTYAIAKLSDGKCWMIENLRLDQNVSLNSTNTQNPSSSSTPANDTANWNSEGTSAIHLRNDNIASPVANASSRTNNIYSYGVYYTWRAAAAGRNPSSGNTTGSICPYNWSLPYSYDNTPGSFQYLTNTMDTTSADTKTASFIHYPNNFLYSGDVSGGSVSRNNESIYWSRTAKSSNAAYALSFRRNSSYFNPADSYYKYFGIPVRCIAGS